MSMCAQRSWQFPALLTALCGMLLPNALWAAVPTTMGVEGAIVSSAGGPAADGNYALTFSLLDGPAGNPVWTEQGLTVTVKGGQFATALGVKTPLGAAVFSGDRWLQVQVGQDPPMPTQQVRAVALALRAATADALDCSGCVKAAQLDPAVLSGYAKSSDLAGLAQKSDLSGFAQKGDLADYVKAASLAKVAGTGAYADLLGTPKLADVATSGAYGDLGGLPVLAKVGATCGSGLVMKGIKADGSYECVSGSLSAADLPKNALDIVSNGQLTNKFSQVFASTAVPIDIADNLPAGVADGIVVPDVGTAIALTVSVKLTNSDVSKVRITLFDPAGAAHTLYDQNGKGTALDLTFPAPDAVVKGDLAAWVGKNPKGTWSISVADLAGPGGKDGKLTAWSINVSVLSNQKVASVGLLQTPGGLQVQNADKPPVTCGPTTAGYIYFNTATGAFYGCNGKNFVSMSGAANSASCAEILKADPTSKDGIYTIDPDGTGPGAPLDVLCDMTTNGGGWTMLVRLDTNDGATRNFVDNNFWNSPTSIGTLGGGGDYLSAAYDTLPFTQITLKYSYQGPAVVAATFANPANAQSLRKNLNLTGNNANPAWSKAWVNAPLADQFYGPVLRFQTTGNDTDYSRIWYNLTAVNACNQGGSIGHDGDYPGNDWYWEVARGSDLDAGGCQHNTYRLGLGSNYNKKSWGGTDVQPTAFYSQGVMLILVK